MKIFVAGATGAIGKRLVPMLVNAGHKVTAATHRPEKAETIRAAGATPVIVDALNAREVLEAVEQAAPEVIIHELTAISAKFDPKHFSENFAGTNRLRIEGTDNLLAAARAVGCRRFIAQSYGGTTYERRGGWVKSEEDPLLAAPEPEFRDVLQAIRHLESAVLGQTGMQGFVLRYGSFYGPGTFLGEGGSMLDEVRRRRMPIVGRGEGVWSFIQIDDAAAATVAAIDASIPGLYNIADDEPVRVSEWLPYLAEVLGAKPPRHVPVWLARLVVGSFAVAMMTEIRGMSNEKAKALLGWKLRYPSWRKGFREGLGTAIVASYLAAEHTLSQL